MLKKKVFFRKSAQKSFFEEILDATLVSVMLSSFYFESTKLVRSLFCRSQHAQNTFRIHWKQGGKPVFITSLQWEQRWVCSVYQEPLLETLQFNWHYMQHRNGRGEMEMCQWRCIDKVQFCSLTYSLRVSKLVKSDLTQSLKAQRYLLSYFCNGAFNGARLLIVQKEVFLMITKCILG